MLPLPFVSVIIVSWNSAEHLPRCLDSLSLQTFQHFEVILVVNGSQQGIVGLEEKYPALALHVEQLASNQGFAVANNIGARLARGRWLALLNADAFPKPDWLEKLLDAARRHPEFSFFSSRQLQFAQPDILDGAGDEYHISGLAWRRLYNHPAQHYGLQEEEVFSACAAAAMYSREEFLQVGGFDESYFAYFEDVDVGFRLRLAGGRCLYVHEAEVCHVGSASSGKTSDFVRYHGHRNMVWTFFKNMPSYLFWWYLPLHIATNFFFAFSFLLKGEGAAVLRAKLAAFYRLPAIIRKRRQIQETRKISVREVWKAMNSELLAPYWARRGRVRGSSRT
jgi:GT2 family glycosyltransferase